VLMSGGTAITTGALAALAVYARDAAQRFSNPERRWTGIAGGGFELLAAAAVMGLVWRCSLAQAKAPAPET